MLPLGIFLPVTFSSLNNLEGKSHGKCRNGLKVLLEGYMHQECKHAGLEEQTLYFIMQVKGSKGIRVDSWYVRNNVVAFELRKGRKRTSQENRRESQEIGRGSQGKQL